MGNTIWLLMLCLPAVIAIGWVHYRLRTHALNTRLLTGAILLLMGVAFGWVVAFIYTQSEGLQQVLVFLSGVGLVHVPAAFILELKHWQHSETD